MGLHDNPSHPESRQALSAHFNRPRTRSAASDSSTAEPCLAGFAAEPRCRLLQLLRKALIAAAPPIPDPPETRLELICHVKIPQRGYGASWSCCKHWRPAASRCLDPVQWALKNRCADKAQGKAWRQLF
jgi:hypothetical protein